MPSGLKALPLLASLAFGYASAASFPPTPEGLTIVNTAYGSISYKETHICETTEGTRSFAGYVSLTPDPSSGRQSYPINTFFWYFGARNDPENAPLSLWLSGGPGAPSVANAVGANGPCLVNIDSRTTELNPWSWNENVNMLYIDQPVQVGLSYDVLTNGTIDEIKSPFAVTPFESEDEVPETNTTLLTGTFASQQFTNAPNTTDMAAAAMWKVMQAWTQDFPEAPKDKKISIWAQSYGGHWAPTFAAYFQKQNARIDAGELDDTATKLELDTVGLINACVDIDTQIPFYPEYAYNNTYGIQVITEEEYDDSLASLPQCKELTQTCRTMEAELDPEGYGNVTDVNDACYFAYDFCFSKLQYPYERSGRYHFNINEGVPGSFPPKLAAGYLNTAEVQQALGSPVNFTGLSAAIAVGFNVSGDFVKGQNLAHLGELLQDGVKVALVYGDADYQCNWYGGEALSLAIDHESSDDFEAAGYAELQTNADYVGGLVRQQGNLTFSRVFDAGHEVPWYQPETAQQIFNRVMFDKDVATGEFDVTDDYASRGPSSVADVMNEPAAPKERYCYLWDMLETCMPEEYEIVLSGKAIIKDFILLGYTAANGTNVYLLEGTEVGDQLMGEGAGQNRTADSSTPLTQTEPNGAGNVNVFWSAWVLLIVGVVWQIVLS